MKVCTEEYTYTCTDPAYKNLTVTIEPGACILLPVNGLHKDEKLFKSPEEFIPERFLDRTEINRYCYLAFGEGPRECLGIIRIDNREGSICKIRAPEFLF